MQAVKCHANTNARNAAANPRPAYTMFSNISVPIVLRKYKAVEDNIAQMKVCAKLSHTSYEDDSRWYHAMISTVLAIKLDTCF
ncbi:hypothetical protein [Nitrososphaera sp. AFS]|uniref:hypothetical protein n=1 Tax=Nitrososphaera sp. AFS TaxID=2301191 RepID=UPI0013923EED|nr:hypothetical protein [Nitrososphaera sp. AFS]NAL78478.1 hypothetical protein [Nitrososphaera sp. AFS]